MAASSSTHRTAGLVLAGGLSTRFGSEKAAALLDGRALLLHALDHLGAIPKAVSARPGSQAEALSPAPVLHDAPGDAAGPLAGIRAGLIWAAAQGAALLAVEPCDLPFAPPDLHALLITALCDASAAYAETEDGPQPLCAVWRIDALPALDAALAGGRHPSVWRFLDSLGARRLMFSEAERFRNANTPDALRR